MTPLEEAARRKVAAEEASHPGPRPSANGRFKPADLPPIVPEYRPEDIATVDDLIRAGADVRWLWEGWIPSAVLTAIAGLAGIGKTRFCADLVRRVRRGLPWPDGKPPTADVAALALWVVADNHHDQLVNLAQTFGIKESLRINAPRTDPYGGVSIESPEDYGQLEGRIKALRPALVIVDTVGNATDKNLGRQEDAKAFYQPLQLIARRYNTAILCLTHLNATGQFLGRRVLEKVRVAIRIEQPEGQERLRVEVVKTFGKLPPPLGAVMGDDRFDFDDNPPARSEAVQTAGPVPTRLREAVDWLRDLLQGGPKGVKETRDRAQLKGFDAKLLYRAKAALDIREYEAQGYKHWTLTASDELPQ